MQVVKTVNGVHYTVTERESAALAKRIDGQEARRAVKTLAGLENDTLELGSRVAKAIRGHNVKLRAARRARVEGLAGEARSIALRRDFDEAFYSCPGAWFGSAPSLDVGWGRAFVTVESTHLDAAKIHLRKWAKALKVKQSPRYGADAMHIEMTWKGLGR